MNIALFSSRSPYGYPGGAEILTKLIAESLSIRGHKVVIYTGGPIEGRIARGVSAVTLPLLRPGKFRTVLTPFRARLLWRMLASDRFFRSADIVHAVDMDSILLLTRLPDAIGRLIVTIQDYGLLGSTKEYDLSNPPDGAFGAIGRLCEGFRTSVRSRFHEYALRRIRYAVCVSRYVEQLLASKASWIRTRVIGNCVPDHWFQSDGARRDIHILYVGKMERYKGVHVFFDSVAILRKRLPGLRVVCIGSGSLKPPVWVRHLQLPHERISTYYRRAKIVVVPSLWPEPCGRTIVEAMSSRASVVATRVGGTPETMQDQRHGLLVRAGDPKELADACMSLLDKPAWIRRFGNASYAYAKRHYTCDRIVKQYEAFYRLPIRSIQV